MENDKVQSIRIVGISIVVLSAFIIFSNGMGALMALLIASSEGSQPTIDATPMGFIFAHYLEMCLFLVSIGIAYLLGGIFIQRFKLWANRLVTAISALQVLVVWIMMIIVRSSFAEQEGLEILNVWTIAVALIWTGPFGLLIWFLNKKGVIRNFQ
jgi:hypothetical protein